MSKAKRRAYLEALEQLHELGAWYVKQKDRRAVEKDWNGSRGRSRPPLNNAIYWIVEEKHELGVLPGSLGLYGLDFDAPGAYEAALPFIAPHAVHTVESSPGKFHVYCWIDRSEYEPDEKVRGGQLVVPNHPFPPGKDSHGDLRVDTGHLRLLAPTQMRQDLAFWAATPKLPRAVLDSLRKPQRVRPQSTGGKRFEQSASDVELVVREVCGDRPIERADDEWRIGTHGSVSVMDNGDYYDFEREMGGGLVHLIMDMRGVGWDEARRERDRICGTSNVVPFVAPDAPEPTEESLQSYAEALDAWRRRGFVKPEVQTSPQPPEDGERPNVAMSFLKKEESADGKGTKTAFVDSDRQMMAHMAYLYLPSIKDPNVPPPQVEIRYTGNMFPNHGEVGGRKLGWAVWWDGRGWCPVTKEGMANQVGEEAQKVVRTKQPDGHGRFILRRDERRAGHLAFLTRAVNLMKDVAPFHTRHERWHANPALLGMPGGKVVDLAAGEGRDMAPDDLIWMSTAVSPRIEMGPSTDIEKLLPVSFPNDDIRFFALCLMAQALFGGEGGNHVTLVQGPSRTGKTAIYGCLLRLAGDYGVVVPNEHLMKGGDIWKRGNAEANMNGKRIALIKDLPEVAQAIEEGRLKAVVDSGAGIARQTQSAGNVEVKYEASTFVLGNDIPPVDNLSGAVLNRLFMLHTSMEAANLPKEVKVGAESVESQQALFQMLLRETPRVHANGLPPEPPQITTWRNQWGSKGDRYLAALMHMAVEDGVGAIPLKKLAEMMSTKNDDVSSIALGRHLSKLNMDVRDRRTDVRGMHLIGWKLRDDDDE